MLRIFILFYYVHILVSNLSLDKINQPSISSSFIKKPQISNISLSPSPIPASTCITPSLQMSTGTTINEPLSTSFRNIYANDNLQQPSTLAKCLTIRPSKKGNYMPSTAIDRSELVHPSVIINKYPAYRTPSRIPTLARKLAEHSYFGVAVLKQCTIAGYRDEPALPIRELNDLKSQIFDLLPQFWTNPLEFEPVWTDCTVSIGQLCKTCRLKEKKK